MDQKTLFDAEWEKSQGNPIIKTLNKGFHFSTVIRKLIGAEVMRRAFNFDFGVVACGDGRVKVPLPKRKIGIAGQGILLSYAELERFIDMNYGTIKEVWSHSICGAGKLAHDLAMKKSGAATGSRLMLVAPDEFAAQNTKEFANRLEAADYHHVSQDKLACQVHNERMIVMDAMGRFCPAAIPNFPEHFLASGWGYGLKPSDCIREIEIYADIAFSDHGFGERFTEQEPFFILVTVFHPDEFSRVRKRLWEIEEKYGNRVLIIDFCFVRM
jgi:hypothetical protein